MNTHQRGLLPIGTHLALMSLSELLGVPAALLSAERLCSLILAGQRAELPPGAELAPGGLETCVLLLLTVGMTLLGYHLPKRLFRLWLPAACPRGCGGAAWPVDKRPIRYVCRQCGACQVTNVWEKV